MNTPSPDLPVQLGAGHVLGLLTVAFILGIGQLFFKIAAERLVVGRGLAALAWSMVGWPMATVLTLYAIATVLWVYLLHGLPLSRAYPFIALVFAFVPLLSWIVFRDSLDLRYGIGLVLMVAGLYLIASTR
ncbi:MAG TPA: EamA family transporter [Gammaproteobacteria bacterium]|nr:EamA family transporter [Gammaproteobacteria bacterium]